MELGEKLALHLTNMGMPSSASEGLTTLVNKLAIIYSNLNEVSRSATYGSTIYDNNMSVRLPTNCEITFEVWSNNNYSGSEHRFFLLPKSQYNSGTTQPTEALFFDIFGNGKSQFGKRENDATYYFVNNVPCSLSTYHTIKIIKNGTTIEMYLDSDLKTTQTVSWIDNHSDYCLSMMRWSSSGTSKIKNVLIRSL